MADIPSEGSGLGSSSTVTVGLLNAMYTYLGTPRSQEDLAREACEIEISVLGKPIGKQDQYIAAYGGQRFIRFCDGERVEVETAEIDPQLARRLNQNLMLFYTNVARKAESVLAEQRQNVGDRLDVLRAMKTLALQGARLSV
jgi:D-glycero-alpha-D-manno-heptose-7-phosphate kinase